MLQEAQESEIRRLEKEVDMMRFRHADEVHKLKSSFLAEKRDLQQSADAKVAELQQKANVVREPGRRENFEGFYTKRARRVDTRSYDHRQYTLFIF